MSMLNSVTNRGTGLPPRIVMHAQEKFGKTSLFAYAPNPIFAMTKGETGLISLLDGNRIPAVDYYPEDFKDWWTFIDFLKALRDDKHDYKTLIIDTGNGLEQLCCDMVCKESYDDKWELFMNYHKGFVTAQDPWQKMIGLLDELRGKRKMMVVILHHTKVKPFSDPNGKTWDQWQPEGNEKLWGLTRKWVDVILFGGWEVPLKKDNAKEEKAVGQPSRYLQAGSVASSVAGNRYGISDKITANGGADKLWSALSNELNRCLNTKPPAKEPAKESSKNAANEPTKEEPKEKKKLSRAETAINWWGGKLFDGENYAADFVKNIEKFHAGNVKEKMPCPEQHTNVIEFVREHIEMGDLEEFKDLSKEKIALACKAVIAWLKLCPNEPAK